MNGFVDDISPILSSRSIAEDLKDWEGKRFISSEAEVAMAFMNKSVCKAVVLKRDQVKKLRFICQVDRKFIVCSVNQILVALDQHAIHERILMENFLNMAKDSSRMYRVSSAFFLQRPQKVLLSDLAMRQLNKKMTNTRLLKWGWNWKASGKEIVTITSSPNILGRKVKPDQFSDWINSLKDDSLNIPDAAREIIVSKACRRAIKFGDFLTEAQCLSLLIRLAKCGNPFNCAHGRPSIAPIADLNWNDKEYIET